MLQCPHQNRVNFKITSDSPEHCPGKLRITPRQMGGCSLTWGSNRNSRAQPAGDDSAIHIEKSSELPGKMRLQVAVARSAQGLSSATEVRNPLHIPLSGKVISFQNVLWAVKAILAACNQSPSQSILRKHPSFTSNWSKKALPQQLQSCHLLALSRKDHSKTYTSWWKIFMRGHKETEIKWEKKKKIYKNNEAVLPVCTLTTYWCSLKDFSWKALICGSASVTWNTTCKKTRTRS